MASGFEVNINDNFSENHRANSKILLKDVWTNLAKLFTGPQDVYTIEHSFAILKIHRVKGWGWLTVPVFPFAMLHESLHFIIGMVTRNENLIIAIPPILDTLTLPLWFLYFQSIPFTFWAHNFPLFIGLTLWIEWTWFIHLNGNITGDFKTLFSRPK